MPGAIRIARMHLGQMFLRAIEIAMQVPSRGLPQEDDRGSPLLRQGLCV